jgi:hypothetical protein
LEVVVVAKPLVVDEKTAQYDVVPAVRYSILQYYTIQLRAAESYSWQLPASLELMRCSSIPL